MQTEWSRKLVRHLIFNFRLKQSKLMGSSKMRMI